MYKARIKLKSQCAALQSIQTEMFSVGIWSRCSQCQKLAGEMAGCSTDAVPLQQNFCHRSCCVFLGILALEKRSWRWSLSDSRWMSSARYLGALPDNDWYTRHASLNVTRWRTGSRCNWRRTGVMWSQLSVPVMRCTAASELTGPSARGRRTRIAVASYNSLGDMLWMPELMFWQPRLSATERLDVVVGASYTGHASTWPWPRPFQGLLTKYFLWDVNGKLYSKFGEDRSRTELTMLTVIAWWTDTGSGRMDGRMLKCIYILSNAIDCIGQTTRKPCCRKETARWRSCSFQFKVRRRHSLQV